jgi:hypothetical protein
MPSTGFLTRNPYCTGARKHVTNFILRCVLKSGRRHAGKIPLHRKRSDISQAQLANGRGQVVLENPFIATLCASCHQRNHDRLIYLSNEILKSGRRTDSLKSLVQGPQGFGCDFVDLSNRHRCRRKFYPLSPSLISSFFEIVLPYQQKPPSPFALRRRVLNPSREPFSRNLPSRACWKLTRS